MPIDKVSFYNRIDMGIFICFLELCLEHEGIEFEREFFTDNGMEDEMTLNTVYTFIAIKRVKKYEAVMTEAEQILKSRNTKQDEKLKFLLSELEEYYKSDEWKKDFTLEESGFFPSDIKRGVLSEDGIYNLLDSARDML